MNTSPDERRRRPARHRWGRGIAPLVLLSGICPLPPAVATTLTRGPYLQMATTTGAWIHWSTSVPAESWVFYGDAPDQLTQTVSDLVPKTVHGLRIRGLPADTRHYYAVGSSATTVLAGGDAEHFLTTAPLPGTAVPTRIWVVGDSGTADANAEAVRDGYLLYAGSRSTDVWLMLGDNAYYSGTESEYQAAVFAMYPSLLRQTFLWPTFGNHDAVSADADLQSGPYFDLFHLPTAGQAGGLASGTEAYYSFDHGDVHFICLDSSESDRSPRGAMMEWLAADLASTTRTWIVAYFHHPPYSKGSHDSDDPEESGGRLFDMREIAVPILEDGGVDLVLSGHSHAYERSFLLDGHYGTSDTLLPEMILDTGDGQPAGTGAYEKMSQPHQGTVYIIAGSSGLTSGGSLDHPVMSSSLNELGSLVLDVDKDRLDATFLDINGDVLDALTLIKMLFRDGFETGDLRAWSSAFPQP